MPIEPTNPALARMCELQQLQLEKLDEIARRLTESAEAANRSHEEYVRQGMAYEQSLSAYQASDRSVVRVVTWRAILIAIMLGLIVIAILVR